MRATIDGMVTNLNPSKDGIRHYVELREATKSGSINVFQFSVSSDLPAVLSVFKANLLKSSRFNLEFNGRIWNSGSGSSQILDVVSASVSSS